MFLNKLKYNRVRDKPPLWELTEDLRYQDKKGKIWRVRAGFRTDFASLKTHCSRKLLKARKIRESAVLHDWCYNKDTRPEGMTKKKADKLFKEALKSQGLNKTRVNLYYIGVKLFAHMAWN